MRIKKHSSKNRYVMAGGVWVRDFTQPSSVKSLNLSSMFSNEDRDLAIQNELANRTLGHGKISDESLELHKILIVSDGYEFEQRHEMLRKLPSDVVIFAVNGALKKWKLYEPTATEKRPINIYIANNPYSECSGYLPAKNGYFPSCVASTRTAHDFIKRYRGNVYFYESTPEEGFGLDKHETYFIDDYRNPICAAIGLAHRCKVKKLMLFCCDDTFKLPNGLWTYPHHIRSQEIIDANLYWLTHQEDTEIKVSDHSSGLEYENADYIKSVEDIIRFFNEDEDEEGTKTNEPQQIVSQ